MPEVQVLFAQHARQSHTRLGSVSCAALASVSFADSATVPTEWQRLAFPTLVPALNLPIYAALPFLKAICK